MGQLIETEQGTPQGAVISPLLANIYLHYVYDLWVPQPLSSGSTMLARRLRLVHNLKPGSGEPQEPMSSF